MKDNLITKVVKLPRNLLLRVLEFVNTIPLPKFFIVLLILLTIINPILFSSKTNQNDKVIIPILGVILLFVLYRCGKFGTKKFKESDLLNWRKKNILFFSIQFILVTLFALLKSQFYFKYVFSFASIFYGLLIIRLYKGKFYIRDGKVFFKK